MKDRHASPIEHVATALADGAARDRLARSASWRDRLLYELGILDFLHGHHRATANASRIAELEVDVVAIEVKLGVGRRTRQMPEDAVAGGDVYAAWGALNVPRWLAGASPASRPEAVIVAGQPGAGKSVVTESLCRHFAATGHCVTVDARELLYLHPNYAERAGGSGPQRVAAELGPQARRLAADLLDAAIDRRLHVVVDTTLAHPDSAVAMGRRLREAGYAVSVIALCVPPDVSWAAAEERASEQKRQFGIDAVTDRDAHDAACRGLVRSLIALAQQGHTDEMHVLTREGVRLTSIAGEVADVAERARSIYEAFRGCFPDSFLPPPLRPSALGGAVKVVSPHGDSAVPYPASRAKSEGRGRIVPDPPTRPAPAAAATAVKRSDDDAPRSRKLAQLQQRIRAKAGSSIGMPTSDGDVGTSGHADSRKRWQMRIRAKADHG